MLRRKMTDARATEAPFSTNRTSRSHSSGVQPAISLSQSCNKLQMRHFRKCSLSWNDSAVTALNQVLWHGVCRCVSPAGRRLWCIAKIRTSTWWWTILAGSAGSGAKPFLVVGFNSAKGMFEGCIDVARELHRRCDLQLRDVPPPLRILSNGTKAATFGS
jgi:hypothetical protein